jgi:hypothetical protein
MEGVNLLIESMMCLPLYNDMALSIFGLYEDNDERLPYSLLVVAIDEDEMYIFASKKDIELNGKIIQTSPYKEWVKNHPDIIEIPRRFILHYEPNVTSCKLSDPDLRFNYDKEFFENTFDTKDMDLLHSWPVCTDRVFLLIYKDKTFKDSFFPELMQDTCEAINFVWHEFFSTESYRNAKPPHIDINETIESIDKYKELAPYFKTITKISSLFYEKTHSMGSIAIMKNKVDYSILIMADNEEETLSFSMEHAKLLRKLLETTRNHLSLLVYEKNVYGIGKPDNENIKYIFNLTGQMEWHIIDHSTEGKSFQILRYKHGKYYLPANVKIKNREWYINNKIKDEVINKTVNKLLTGEESEAFKHGALLIITDKAKDEVHRLCEKKRGLRTEPIDIISEFNEASALCDIDGALFLDKKGFCHGIGIILDGEAIVNGTPVRGSRFNSAKTYISRCAAKRIEAYALIISTDGNYDILTTNDAEYIPIMDIQENEDAG